MTDTTPTPCPHTGDGPPCVLDARHDGPHRDADGWGWGGYTPSTVRMPNGLTPWSVDDFAEIDCARDARCG